MIWYTVLLVLGVLFALISIGALIIYILSNFEVPEMLILVLVAGIVFGGCAYGTSEIEKKNTTITTEVVEMEVLECNILINESENMQVKYCITVEDFLIKTTYQQYADITEGDIVAVEITTKTVFDKTTKTAALV